VQDIMVFAATFRH